MAKRRLNVRTWERLPVVTWLRAIVVIAEARVPAWADGFVIATLCAVIAVTVLRFFRVLP
jgi:hypothetical protein